MTVLNQSVKLLKISKLFVYTFFSAKTVYPVSDYGIETKIDLIETTWKYITLILS